MAAFSAAMRARISGRLLLLQSCWSYQAMQGRGLALAMEPWLRSLYGARAEAELARYEACFNTHPFMAPLTVGVLCGLEEEAAAGGAEEKAAVLKRAEGLKTALACSLAGVGDALFWGALRPACAAAALVLGVVSARPLFAAIAYLVLYNATALPLRWHGLSLGYQWKADLPKRLKAFQFQRWIKGLKWAAMGLLVAFMALLALGQPGVAFAGVVTALAYLTAAAYWPRLTAASFYFAVCGLGVIGGAAGWI